MRGQCLAECFGPVVYVCVCVCVCAAPVSEFNCLSVNILGYVLLYFD